MSARYIEDSVITQGWSGAFRSLDALQHVVENQSATLDVDAKRTVVFGTDDEGFYVSNLGEERQYERTGDPVLDICFEMQNVVSNIGEYHAKVLFHGDFDFVRERYMAYQNAVVYGVDAASDSGQAWRNSKLGLAIVSKYVEGHRVPVDYDSMQESDDIWICDLRIKPIEESTKNRILDSIDIARELGKLLQEDCDPLTPISLHVLGMRGIQMRHNMNPTITDQLWNLKEYIDTRFACQARKARTDSGRNMLMERQAEYKKNLPDDDSIKSLFEMVHLIETIKDSVFEVLNLNTELMCYDKKSTRVVHKGFVIENGHSRGSLIADRRRWYKITQEL